ncbi:MAG: large conductance mechanosensitive channel protein MscL [Egibacteraceae bacterium]
MLEDFKAFILRGNVLDLAIGVMIGAAFGTVVESLVKDVFTPLLAIPGQTNFESLQLTIGGGVIKYGAFVNAVIAFLTIAVAVFFFVVRPMNALMARRGMGTDPDAGTKDCEHCLSSIPARARVCAFCARDLTAPV